LFWCDSVSRAGGLGLPEGKGIVTGYYLVRRGSFLYHLANFSRPNFTWYMPAPEQAIRS
jgi:hypothetical protein